MLWYLVMVVVMVVAMGVVVVVVTGVVGVGVPTITSLVCRHVDKVSDKCGYASDYEDWLSSFTSPLLSPPPLSSPLLFFLDSTPAVLTATEAPLQCVLHCGRNPLTHS